MSIYTHNKTRAVLATLAMMVIGIFFVMIIATAAGATTDLKPESDTRPCVSRAEVRLMNHVHNRHYLERHWEVLGLGMTQDLPLFGDTVLYPRCGDVKSFPNGDSWIGVRYRSDGVRDFSTFYLTPEMVFENSLYQY